MKKYIILVFLLLTSISAYATNMGVFPSKAQQNRLNAIVRQLKIPFGDYKFTVSSTGTKLENLISTEPQIVTKEVEVIKEVRIEVPVEKIVAVEKQLPTGTITISPEEKSNLRTRCYDNWYGWNSVCVDEFLYSKSIK